MKHTFIKPLIFAMTIIILLCFVAVQTFAAEKGPIEIGACERVSTGWGNSGAGNAKLSSNNGALNVAHGNDWSVDIKSGNKNSNEVQKLFGNKAWVIVATGDIPAAVTFDLYYQVNGKGAATGVFMINVTVNAAGVCEVADGKTGVGSDSINEVRIENVVIDDGGDNEDPGGDKIPVPNNRLMSVSVDPTTPEWALNKKDSENKDLTLVWSDEFNVDGALDASKGWAHETVRTNNELQSNTTNLANSFIDDGKLTIRAQIEPNGQITSARVVTNAGGLGDGQKGWLYGRIEVSAKLPDVLGSWPAIWMYPAGDLIYGAWPASGEIDIMEHVGMSPDIIYSTMHSAAGSLQGQKRMPAGSIYNEFHTYAMEWTPEEMRVFIDDDLIHTVRNESRNGKELWECYPYNRPFFLIINFAFGGDWGGAQGVNRDGLPQDFAIDYVRVYDYGFLDNDVTPPVKVGKPAAGFVRASSVDISWERTTDDVAVFYYQVFKDGAHIANTNGTTYNFSGLTPGETYEFGVKAVDYSGNVSEMSELLVCSTVINKYIVKHLQGDEKVSMRLAAEYDSSENTSLVNSTDYNVTRGVSMTRDDSSVNFTLDVVEAGDYVFAARVTSTAGNQLNVIIDGEQAGVISITTATNTNEYKTFELPIKLSLTEGPHSLRVEALPTGQRPRLTLNWFSIGDVAYENDIVIPVHEVSLSGLPKKILAVDYEEVFNVGFDRDGIVDYGSGVSIDNLRTNSYMTYLVDVKEAGEYVFAARIASGTNEAQNVRVDISGEGVGDGEHLDIPFKSDSWDEFYSVQTRVTLGEGMFRVKFSGDGYNLNWFSLGNEAYDPYSEPMIFYTNGGFDEGTSGWTVAIGTNGSAGAAVWAESDTDAGGNTQDGVMAFNITAQPSSANTVNVPRLQTANTFSLIPGRDYQIKFKARATQTRKIIVMVADTGYAGGDAFLTWGSYTGDKTAPYSQPTQNRVYGVQVDLSDEWQEYTITFTMGDENIGGVSRLVIGMGNVGGSQVVPCSIFFDDISFELMP